MQKVGLKAIQGVPIDGDLPTQNSFINISQSDKIVIAAVKCAEDKNGYIIRSWNKTAEDADCEVEISLPISNAKLVKMDETELSDLTIDNKTVKLKIAAHKIETIKIF